jgi:ATP-dependent Lon protease
MKSQAKRIKLMQATKHQQLAPSLPSSKVKANRTKLTGFKLYLQRERQILQNCPVLEKTWSSSHRFMSRSKDMNPFAENVGLFELFKMSELNQLYQTAGTVFGDDAKQKARELLQTVGLAGNRKSFAAPPSDESLASLRLQFPNFSKVIDQIACSVALSRLTLNASFNIPPLLLVGPPGVGKTAFCQVLAKIVSVPFKRIDVGTLTMPAKISGLSFGWASGHVGEIFHLLTSSEVVNPMLMLDEIDKLQHGFGRSLEPALLSLLEPETARTFRDEAILLDIDASRINYIATANELNDISAPLRSRFTIAEIEAPTQQECLDVVQNIYHQLLISQPWGKVFAPSLSIELLEALSNHPPRRIRVLLLQACGQAAMKGRVEVRLEDVPNQKLIQTAKFGFIN